MTTGDSSDLAYAVASDGARIAYRLEGPDDAPAVMFSNSIGTTHHLWDEQARRLGDRFRILRYDTRGHGASDAPAGPYVLERLAADALSVLEAANLRAVTFCGLSLGGLTGQWLIRHAPHVLRGVILANTAVRFAPQTLWDERIATVTREGMSAIVAAIGRWFTPEFAAENPAIVARFRTEFEAIDPVGYAGCCAVLRDADAMPDAADRIPALVVIGNHDQATPPAAGEEVAASIAGARIVRLETAHLSNVARPAEFSDLVAGFADANGS